MGAGGGANVPLPDDVARLDVGRVMMAADGDVRDHRARQSRAGIHVAAVVTVDVGATA